MSDQQASQLIDHKGRLWQERTVVVKKDPEGFGFTLSKEMPVFVDSVSPGSSAFRAGILSGDRIVKVNGVSVMGHKHNDVVEMIRDSTIVTLTLIGKLSQNGTKAQSSKEASVEISHPRQLQELTLQSLKVMLQKQRRMYESLSVDYSKQPAERLEKELRDCESIIKILEVEIASKAPIIESHIQTTNASIMALTGKQVRSHPLIDEQTLTRKLLAVKDEDILGTVSRKNYPLSVSPTKGFFSPTKPLDNPKPSCAHTFNGTISPSKGGRGTRRGQISLPVSPGAQGEGSDYSDDDLSDEVDGASEAGPFSTLQDLRNNPAHMSVFLHYLYLNKDPKYLLFYLIAGSYQIQCKTSDLVQRGMDIFWTFFLENSPLPLEVEESMKTRIVGTLESEESENKLRSTFVEVRESLSETIIADLANYRHKRVMGLAGMFGDHMLTNHMTIAKQIEVVHSMLLPDLKQCLDERSSSNPEEMNRNQAVAACIATFILDATGRTKDKNITPPLDKVQTFSRVDLLFKKGKSGKKKSITTSKCGHSFQLTSYSKPTACSYCSKLLWGIIYHGYQCQVCELNIHRHCCIGDLAEACPRKRRKSSAPQRKHSLSTLPGAPDELEAMDTTSRDDEENDRMSPPPDTVRAMRSEGEGERPQARRDRSISEPKQHALLVHMNSFGTELTTSPTTQPTEPLANESGAGVTRTQSERLRNKPEHAKLKQANSIDQNLSATISLASMQSSSDDSLIGGTSKGGSLEAIVEVGGKPQPPVIEDLSELLDDEIEDEPIPWALTAKREVAQGMKRYEVQRQEYIKELVYTERRHLQKLKIMRHIYKIPLVKQNILSVKQVDQLFPSLEELILFHSGLCEGLKERVALSPNGVVRNISDSLLQRFDGAAGERLCHACSVFASNQSKADRLFKEWKRKNERFRVFIKNAETHPLCEKLTLSELMPIAWQRLTKYKLLIDNILGSYKKHWDELDDSDKEEGQKVETALSSVKTILQYVNKQVRRSGNKQRLLDYQSKLDTSAFEKASHPLAQLYKNFDLTAENRKLVYEGALTWRIQHRRVVELRALLLTDVLVLMEKHEDKDKYYLRCHTLENVNGVKEELSSVIRLKECLLRHAAADKGGRTFLMVNNSSLMKLAQMYEFIAEGPREKKQWEEAIKKAMIGTQDTLSPDIPISPAADDFVGRVPLGLSTMTSHLSPREQLDKIDDDMKKLLTDKLTILRAMQGGVAERPVEPLPQHPQIVPKTLGTPRDIILATIEQTGEITSTISHIMVPNPTKSTIAETQFQVSDIITEMQRNLSKLLVVLGEQPPDSGTSGSVEINLDYSLPNPEGNAIVSASSSGEDLLLDTDLQIPPLPLTDDFSITYPQATDPLPAADSLDSLTSGDGDGPQPHGSQIIIAPPESFSGEDSATPTPQLLAEMGRDSDRDTLTPTTDSGETLSPAFEEVHLRIGSWGDSNDQESPKMLEPPSDDKNKRESIGPGIKVLTVISSSEANVQDQTDAGEPMQSFSLSRSRQLSTTSIESDTQEQSPEYTQDMGVIEEGTDL